MRGHIALALSYMRQPRLTRGVLTQMEEAIAGRVHSKIADPIRTAADWLLLAQKSCPDGNGYSRCFRCPFGWDRGYVETTGYIIPTMLKLADHLADERYRLSALAAGDWLLQRQDADGSFNEIDHNTPQAFDTGQVLLGLNALTRALPKRDDYRQAAMRAASWLAENIGPDGTWTHVAYGQSAHTYYSRSAAAMLETGLMHRRSDFITAGHRQLEWVLSRQLPSGWFLDCEFECGRPALLHTIVYVMEGLLMAYELCGSAVYYDAARRSALGLLSVTCELPLAYYGSDWKPASTELCITGLAQWVGVCRRLDRLAGSRQFEKSAAQSMALLKALQIHVPGPLYGALPNIIPWWGSYGKMGAYNWNVKYFADALLEI